MQFKPTNPYIDVYRNYSGRNCYSSDGYHDTMFCPFFRFQHSTSCYQLARHVYSSKTAFDSSGLPHIVYDYNVRHDDDGFIILSTNCRNLSNVSYNPGIENVVLNNTILVMAFMLVIPAVFVIVKMTSKIVRIFR